MLHDSKKGGRETDLIMGSFLCLILIRQMFDIMSAEKVFFENLSWIMVIASRVITVARIHLVFLSVSRMEVMSKCCRWQYMNKLEADQWP